MRLEFFIASRLRPSSSEREGSPSLNVALTGIVLAIVVMILSIAIVTGFKREITNKVYSLDSHLKIGNAVLGLDNNYSSVDSDDVRAVLDTMPGITSAGLIIEKPAILKTDDNFMGLVYRGVDSAYDWRFIGDHLIAGRVPAVSDTSNQAEVALSQVTARALNLDVGDKVLTYFIDDKVKMRNSLIVGIFSTDFETHDHTYMLGNIAQLQGVNGWDENMGNYVGVNLEDPTQADLTGAHIYSDLAMTTYSDDASTTLYTVTSTTDNNAQFFTWLAMLDTNVVIILTLMMIVTGFTLIAALLMIVLERIKMIGLLKALGATNGMIRRTFIYLTGKLVIKALVIGNVVAIGLALLQHYFHILRLDPESYYMPYVPVSINPLALVLLNVGILVVAYITLLAPSMIIASIRPTTTMRFE